jgi:hypothetical protein
MKWPNSVHIICVSLVPLHSSAAGQGDAHGPMLAHSGYRSRNSPKIKPLHISMLPRLARLRQLASTPEEHLRIAIAHAEHMNLVFADRAADDRGNKLSQQSCSPGSLITGRAIKIDVDGMDQSKFKCPRIAMVTTSNLNSEATLSAYDESYWCGVVFETIAKTVSPVRPGRLRQCCCWSSRKTN